VRYTFRKTIELDTPPSQVPVPEGITIRPFVREHERRALIRALREMLRENWGYVYVDRGFEMEYEHWMHMLARDPDCDPAPFWFVAVDGGEIAGFTLCHPDLSEEPGMAWAYVAGVRPAWRRRGSALALLQHSFAALYRAGKRKVSLEVEPRTTPAPRACMRRPGCTWRAGRIHSRRNCAPATSRLPLARDRGGVTKEGTVR
jgi:GNAT superfamily N-acetyltransferase